MQTQEASQMDFQTHPDVQNAREHLRRTQDALKRAQEAARQAKDKESAALRAAQEDARRAEQAEQQAVQAARQEQFNKIEAEYRSALEQLSEAIELATGMNDHVRRLEERARQIWTKGSSGLPNLSWQELTEESPTHSTKLSIWRRQLEAYLKSRADPPRRKRRRLSDKD